MDCAHSGATKNGFNQTKAGEIQQFRAGSALSGALNLRSDDRFGGDVYCHGDHGAFLSQNEGFGPKTAEKRVFPSIALRPGRPRAQWAGDLASGGDGPEATIRRESNARGVPEPRVFCFAREIADISGK
jgi:hypothetical protein